MPDNCCLDYMKRHRGWVGVVCWDILYASQGSWKYLGDETENSAAGSWWTFEWFMIKMLQSKLIFPFTSMTHIYYPLVKANSSWHFTSKLIWSKLNQFCRSYIWNVSPCVWNIGRNISSKPILFHQGPFLSALAQWSPFTTAWRFRVCWTPSRTRSYIISANQDTRFSSRRDGRPSCSYCSPISGTWGKTVIYFASPTK